MIKARLIGGTLVLMSLVACGGGSGGVTSPSASAPAGVTLNGNYSGTASDTAYGSGSVQLTLSQSGTSITGTYASQYPAYSVVGGGSVSGTVNNSQTLSATLQPSIPTACPYQLTGTISGGGANISGTYAAFNCSAVVTGTFNVTKQ